MSISCWPTADTRAVGAVREPPLHEWLSGVMTCMHKYRRQTLGLGAGLGLCLAATGAFVSTPANFSTHYVARVNGKEITQHELDVALARTSGTGLTPATIPAHVQHRQALDFLIDQELLIQRGVEIGLLDSDRTVRKALGMAMIDTIVAAVLKQEPTEDTLQTFYASHQAVFRVPSRLRVQQVTFSATGDLSLAQTQAEQAAQALDAGMPFPEVQQRFGAAEDVPLPDTLLPSHVLRRHVGPTLTQTALAMQVGEISAPVLSPMGYHILRVAERQAERMRPYQEVKQEVRAEYFRRERDKALDHVLEQLRRESTILLSQDAPHVGSEG